MSEALIAREGLAASQETNVWRAVNGGADGFPWITADRFADVTLVERHRQDADASSLLAALEARFGSDAPIFLKERWRVDPSERNGSQVSGRACDPSMVVSENGIGFRVNLCGTQHTGLFIDSRLARRAVRDLCGEKRVLNLYSYTGGFGLAAAAGGARSTTNVDNKRSALEIAEANYELNGLAYDTRTFMRSDVDKYLKKEQRAGVEYDLIILDPPPRYERPGRRDFLASRGYSSLVARCLGVLGPDGLVLAGLNSMAVDDGRFEEMLDEASAMSGRVLSPIASIGPGPDFPPCDERPVARFRLCEVWPG